MITFILKMFFESFLHDVLVNPVSVINSMSLFNYVASLSIIQGRQGRDISTDFSFNLFSSPTSPTYCLISFLLDQPGASGRQGETAIYILIIKQIQHKQW